MARERSQSGKARGIVRISALLLGAAGAAAPAAPPPSLVTVVRGTLSAPNAAEQRYSANTAARISRWLYALGIPHDVTDDGGVVAGDLAGARVALLCYNPRLPARELRRIEEFLQNGGKLIVCYSQDPRLAAMMGLNLGLYSAAQKPGQWSAFRFDPAALAHAPAVVFQESGSLRPAYPVSPGTAVIAWWENAQGIRQVEPAWVRSPRGFWMSHVLRDDDAWGKQRLLLALVGACDPRAWSAAVQRYMGFSGAHGGFSSLSEAADRISADARAAGRMARVEPFLAAATEAREAFCAFAAARRYPEAMEQAWISRQRLSEAYALSQPARSGEIRAVWDDSGLGLYPGDWPRTCRALAAAGINVIFPNAVHAGRANYASRVLSATDAMQSLGDPFAACVAAARAAGIQIHAWKFCWNMEAAPAEQVEKLRRAGRLQVSDSGKALDWLCPSSPENRAFELEQIREIAARYPVDGIHLDYIRYPGPDYCFCAGCRSRFEAATGRRVARWPADARNGSLAAAYREWRQSQISELVSTARRELAAIRPGVRLSAAVYGFYPGCEQTMGQDWGAWLRRGDLDFVCPMNYTSDPERLRGLIRRPMSTVPDLAGRMVCGLGVTARESTLDTIQTLDQIRVTRQEGLAGFALYELNKTIERDILPALALGAGRQP